MKEITKWVTLIAAAVVIHRFVTDKKACVCYGRICACGYR